MDSPEGIRVKRSNMTLAILTVVKLVKYCLGLAAWPRLSHLALPYVN
jgi:hypothetical protein